MRTRTKLKTVAVVGIVLSVWASFAPAAGTDEEEARLISTLQSDKSPGEKDAACQRLRVIGSAKSAPALAGLLTDDTLSMSARLALETLPGPEASQALRQALAKTTGLTRVGIIDSIGIRRDREAVASLIPLLGEADAPTASSAATALGRIGGAEALAALRQARAKATPAVRPAVEDGLLRCAEAMLAGGDRSGAEKLYKELYDSDASEHVRTAACRGWVLSAGENAAKRAAELLAGSDQAGRLAAVQLVREIPGEAATKIFAELIGGEGASKLSLMVQAAVVYALAQRGDKAALPAVITCAAKSYPTVRLAAVRALASMGDASAVAVLVEAAADKEGLRDAALRDAARYALSVLKAPGVADALAACMEKTSARARGEVVQALGARHQASAAPALLKIARSQDKDDRFSAIQAVGQLGEDSAVEPLVTLLLEPAVKADSEELEKTLIEQALASICGRSRRGSELARTLLERRKSAPLPVASALLRVAGRLGGPEATAALRAALADKEPALREAALRTLADFGGLDTAEDLLKLARSAEPPTHRVLALRGYCRLIGLAGDRTPEQRLAMCRDALSAATRPEEKKLAISQLAGLPTPEGLRLAEELAGDEATRGEAEAACATIASGLASSQPQLARAALGRLAKGASDASVRAEAAKALDGFDQYAGYITAWSYAGPYSKAGKECLALFDEVFPPEQAGAKVQWKPLPQKSGPAWMADLLEAAGGHQVVVYVRARVIAPKAAKVRLDMGSDDGLKVWVNGKLVHAHNVMRAVAPNQDRATAELKEGANEFLVKVTQNVMGCAVCIRIRNADGSVIDGLRFE